jgi:hypothetical protein
VFESDRSVWSDSGWWSGLTARSADSADSTNFWVSGIRGYGFGVRDCYVCAFQEHHIAREFSDCFPISSVANFFPLTPQRSGQFVGMGWWQEVCGPLTSWSFDGWIGQVIGRDGDNSELQIKKRRDEMARPDR